MMHTLKSGDLYEHYKGNRYKIIGVSFCSETLTQFVVYQALYDNQVSEIWHRPLEMFTGNLIVDGKEVKRFIKVE